MDRIIELELDRIERLNDLFKILTKLHRLLEQNQEVEIGGGVVFYIESRRFLIRDSPRPATTYEQKTGGADGVKGA